MTRARGYAAGVVLVLLAIAGNGYIGVTNYDQIHTNQVHIKQNVIRNCRQIELVKDGLRETLREAQRFAESSPVRSLREKTQIVQFYGDSLGRLKPRNC